MNVDVLINKPPSIRWYFAAVAPFSALVLLIAFVSTKVTMRRRAESQGKKWDNVENEKSV